MHCVAPGDLLLDAIFGVLCLAQVSEWPSSRFEAGSTMVPAQNLILFVALDQRLHVLRMFGSVSQVLRKLQDATRNRGQVTKNERRQEKVSKSKSCVECSAVLFMA